MSSSDEAEFVKLIETTYRDVNIALANEFACFADAHGLDVAAAIAGANTQPYSHIHSPGVGVGGHCIPIYPYFLLAGAEKTPYIDYPMLMLPRYARQINDAMAEYAVRRIEGITGSLAGQSVLILGVAYRGDVRAVAFTSAQLLQDALLEHGATVYADDPLFSADELDALGYTPFTPVVEGEIRAIIVQANHKAYQSFDFSRFVSCQVVLDGRKALYHEKIESLNMRYAFIGDGVREQLDWRRRERQSILASLLLNGGEQ
jgi:nucleotide sugar dehydrogenase